MESKAVEVLREYKKNYELLRETGKKCITTNNVEVILIPYPEFCEACLALEKLPALKFELGLLRVYNRDYVMRLQKLDRLEKWLKKEYNKIEGKQTERELFILEIVEQLEKKGVVKA